MLAGVGLSWYTWLEQGRAINVSVEVLNAVSRTLRLNESERAYLHRLVGLNPFPPKTNPDPPDTELLQSIVDGWGHNAAYVVDRYWTVVSANRSARILLSMEDGLENLIVTMFTRPQVRHTYPHWQATAARMVARFRAESARFEPDKRYRDMVEQLRQHSPDFAAIWEKHEVLEEMAGSLQMSHPRVGELAFATRVMGFTERCDMRLNLFLPEPGSDTADKLEYLVCLAPKEIAVAVGS